MAARRAAKLAAAEAEAAAEEAKQRRVKRKLRKKFEAERQTREVSLLGVCVCVTKDSVSHAFGLHTPGTQAQGRAAEQWGAWRWEETGAACQCQVDSCPSGRWCAIIRPVV